MTAHTTSSASMPTSLPEGILTEDTLHEISLEISRHYVLFRSLIETWGPDLPRWVTGMVEPQLCNALRLDCLGMQDNFASTEKPFTSCPILYHVRSMLFNSLLNPMENSHSVLLQPSLTPYPREQLKITISKTPDESIQLLLEHDVTKHVYEDASITYSVKLSLSRDISTPSEIAEYDRSEIDTPDGSTFTLAVIDDTFTAFQTALKSVLNTFFPTVSNQWEDALLRQPKAREFVTKLVKQLPRAHDIHFERCLSLWTSFPQDVQTILYSKVHPEYLPLTTIQSTLMQELCFAGRDLLNLAACGPKVMQALRGAEIEEYLISGNTCSSYLGSADCFRKKSIGGYYRDLSILHHLWIAMFEGFRAAQPQPVVFNMVGMTTSRQWPSVTINTSGALDDALSCEISYNGRKHTLQLSGDRHNFEVPQSQSLADATVVLFPDSSPWYKVFPDDSSQYALLRCIVRSFPHKGEFGYDHCRKLWGILPIQVRRNLPRPLSYAYPS